MDEIQESLQEKEGDYEDLPGLNQIPIVRKRTNDELQEADKELASALSRIRKLMKLHLLYISDSFETYLQCIYIKKNESKTQ